ncbi:MAG: hypothetical protein ACR2LF_10475 [Jatrophihabitantaceae bacterium]
MKKSLRWAVPVAALGIAGLGIALPGAASASAASTTYTATLSALNHVTGTGNVTVTVNGNQATVDETFSGLAATFGGKPYPHVQHIHGPGGGMGMGQCPSTSADKNGDGVVSTTEGQPAYGPILTTLSTTGDTSPKAATTLTVAPSGASTHYQRTITLDSSTMSALTSGKAVVVVHGLDPSTLSAKAQAEKSDIVPALPLAATSPALCGVLTASQMSTTPVGSSPTGGGSTSGIQDEAILALGGGLVLVAGGAFAARRRLARES